MKPTKKEQFPGYPQYPQSQDIYSKAKETELDPEEPSVLKTPVKEEGEEPEELHFEDDTITGDDLDIPGSELDDAQENIGNEDEENNYYSLGGDNNQEEDQGL